MKEIRDRGIGRTTGQMLAAPKGAFFVWCTASLEYPRELARKHGREDLQIVSPQWLLGSNYMGLRMSGLIIDHSLDCVTGTKGARSKAQRAALAEHIARAKAYVRGV